MRHGEPSQGFTKLSSICPLLVGYAPHRDALVIASDQSPLRGFVDTHRMVSSEWSTVASPSGSFAGVGAIYVPLQDAIKNFLYFLYITCFLSIYVS